MAAIITGEISPQSFELVRDRIGVILTLELANQFILGADPALDVEVSAKSTDDDSGDVLAMIKCQKLIGVIRAILQDPQYKTLGYAPGFIMSRQSTKIAFANKYQGDSMNTVVGRLMFNVKVPETTEL